MKASYLKPKSLHFLVHSANCKRLYWGKYDPRIKCFTGRALYFNYYFEDFVRPVHTQSRLPVNKLRASYQRYSRKPTVWHALLVTSP